MFRYPSSGLRGQSLIESVIAIAVVMLLLTGLMIGAISSLTRSTNSSLRTKAVKIAQTGLELARLERDTSWTAFTAARVNGGTYCFSESGIEDGSGCAAIDTIYTTSLSFSDDPAGGRLIVSTVSWPENNETRTVTLSTTLTSWR